MAHFVQSCKNDSTKDIHSFLYFVDLFAHRQICIDNKAKKKKNVKRVYCDTNCKTDRKKGGLIDNNIWNLGNNLAAKQFLVIHSILTYIQYLLSRAIFILIKVPTRSALRMLTKAMSVIWIFNNRMVKSAHWHLVEYRFLKMKGNDDTDEVLFFARTRGTQSRVRTFRSHSSQHLRLLYLEKLREKSLGIKTEVEYSLPTMFLRLCCCRISTDWSDIVNSVEPI